MTAVGRARRLLRLVRAGIRTQAAMIVLFGVLVLSGLLGTVGLSLRREEDTSSMVAGHREAETAKLDLVIAMVNQETGIRGYAGTGEQRFLDPYRVGQAAAGPALAELRRQARDPAVAREVEAVRKAALDWSAWAFVTMVHARLDDRSGELRVVDAGHGLAFVLRATGLVERLPVRTAPLGPFRDTVYEEVRLQLAPGRQLPGRLRRRARLHDCLAEDLGVLTPILAGATEPAEVVRRLTTSDRTGPAPDDVTVVVLHRLPV